MSHTRRHNLEHFEQPGKHLGPPRLRRTHLIRIVLERALLAPRGHLGDLVHEVLEHGVGIGAHQVRQLVHKNVQQLQRIVLDILADVGHGTGEVDVEERVEGLQASFQSCSITL